MLQRNKIHIAEIQETHIPHDQNYKYNGYRIIASAATQETYINKQPTKGLPIAGVAILIHEELEHHIVNIKRTNERIIQVALHSKNSHTPLTILCTYAPHSGKTKMEKKDHWEEVKNQIAEIPNKHITICPTVKYTSSPTI